MAHAATLAVTPAQVAVPPGHTVSFEAQVTGTVSASVTWSVLEGPGAGLVSGGTYVAPEVPGTYHVVAQVPSAGLVAEATVVVDPAAPAGIILGIQAPDAEVMAGQSVQLVATVQSSGPIDATVTWSLDPSALGTIDASTGLYTAPASAGRNRVWATSKADPSMRDFADVTVTVPAAAPPPAPAPTPAPTPTPAILGVTVAPSSVVAGQSVRLVATVQSSGTIDTTVTWSLDPSALGSIDSVTGVYTAPSTAGQYLAWATSIADPTRRGSATVTVTPAATPPTITRIFVYNETVPVGGSIQMRVDVQASGPMDTSVTWSMAPGSLGSVGATTGVYTAPATPGTYKVWATCNADPTKMDYGNLTVTAPSGGGSPGATPADYYVSANGSDSNDGRSVGAAFATFGKADSVVQAGQKVQVRGGTYRTNVTLRKSGTSSAPVTWEPYPGEHVVIDGSAIPPDTTGPSPWTSTPNTVRIEGSYVVVRGFEVVNSPNSSFMVFGAHHVTLDAVTAHHGYLPGVSTWNAHDVVLQDSVLHDFNDYGQGGGNGDCVHLNQDGSVPVGNNVIRGNLVYNCSDDGVDAWSQRGNLIERNVAHHCGHGSGDGNGFKLGGNGWGGGNTVRYNVSYLNAMRGYVTNTCYEPNLLYNNVAWGHDAHAGFTNSDGLPHVFRNNINSGTGGVAMTGSVASNNTWNLGISDCRFLSIDPASSDFLHLSSTSPCIDAGTAISGMSYLGAAPDLGPFEAR